VRTIPLNHRIPCAGFLFREQAGERHIIGDILEKITNEKVTFAELGVDQLAVVTNIIVRVVNLSTGIVEFRANAEGKATGNVNPKLNLGIINLTFNEDTSGNFTQSLTGKAIDNAFKKIGEEINQFFNSNL
jgi:hypothetical protein